MNKKTVIKFAKIAALVGTHGVLLHTVSKIELARQQAVNQANTFSAMFGSFVNFAGPEVYQAWEVSMGEVYPVTSDEAFYESSAGSAPAVRHEDVDSSTPEGAAVLDTAEVPPEENVPSDEETPRAWVSKIDGVFAVGTGGEAELQGTHDKDTIHILGDDG